MIVQLDLSSPALLFPTVSLLMLAYTNRFLALASLIRNLHASHVQNPDEVTLREIANLRFRLKLIQMMQLLGVLALFSCVACMLLLYAGWTIGAGSAFAVGLVLMLGSLSMSIWEIRISSIALDLHLRDVVSLTKSKQRWLSDDWLGL
nr:DUF2721 domain-containing protein [Pirellula staleyi]